ncbi:MAG: ATP-binding protein [Armatimonadota bacterium]
MPVETKQTPPSGGEPPERARPIAAWGLLALLMLAALAGNVFSAPLFLGLDFLFGSIAVLVTVALFGTGWGVAAALAGSLYTWLLWNHPYAILILVAEAVFVGLLTHRRRVSLLLADAAFWLLFGIPLVGIFYGARMGTGVEATTLIALKQSVNGIFNALLASLLLTHLPLRRWAGRADQDTVPFRETVFNVMVALVLFPTLLLTVLQGRNEMERIDASLRSQLRLSAISLDSRVEAWIQRHLRAVSALAGIAQRSGPGSRAALQQSAAAIHEAFPDFHNLYLADRNGTTVVFHPPRNARGESTLGLNFSDRDYYRQMRETLKPVVSDIFLGRGGVETPIITVSVPIVENGELTGYALGAVDVTGLDQLLTESLEDAGVQATLMDGERRIIASTVAGADAAEAYQPPGAGDIQPIGGGVFRWVPWEANTPAVTRWRDSFYLRRLAWENVSWTLELQAPVGPYQRDLHRRYLESFVVMLVLTVLALLLALAFTEWLATPLARLATVTTNLPARIHDRAAIPWPQVRIAEIASLVGNYRTMLQALQDQFQALLGANASLEERGQELEERNRALRTEVEERSRVEQALRLSEERYRTVLEESPIATQTFAPDGTWLDANRAWETLWGAKISDLAGYNLLQDPQLERRGVMPWIRRAFSGQPVVLPPVLYEPAEIGAAGRPRWVEAYLYPVKDPAGEIREVVLMLQDITERRLVEEERLRLLSAEQAARERAERLYEEAQEEARRKDQFLAMLAHELRNPLGAVANALHVLQTPEASPEARERALAVLSRQVRHQSRMVDDLLDVSRIERGKVELRCEVLDLVAVVREARDDAQDASGAAGPRLRLEIEPDEPLLIRGDSTRLAQVLGNLLQNARKFTPADGEITLSLRREPPGPDQAGEGTAVITVADTGIGIRREMLPHVFTIFAQEDSSLDRSRGGLGLGLALVKGIVELHGGDVSAVSGGPGKGAAFTVRLPLLATSELDGRETPPAPGPSGDVTEPLHPRRVLVIEDNRDAAETLADMLDLFGYEVAQAYSGPEGLDAAARFHPDVVLCDIGLPGMSGLEVAQALRRDPELGHARLVAVTGYGQHEDVRRTREAGFDHHLTKPIDPETLRSLLESRV